MNTYKICNVDGSVKRLFTGTDEEAKELVRQMNMVFDMRFDYDLYDEVADFLATEHADWQIIKSPE